MRRYTYVGPAAIREAIKGDPAGAPIRSAIDLAPFADGEPRTFVIDADGVLRVAPQRSEHIACAGGGDVLSAGELTAVRGRVVEVSNQSTGFCPEPESWDAVAAALDRAKIPRPPGFTFEAIFRRCPACGQRNIVKDGDFSCGVCGGALPAEWNF